ncbi:MAG: hypothetical protein AAGA88_09565 [Pseudomonadota bacterium]
MEPTLLLIAIPISLAIVVAQKVWANRTDPDQQFGIARTQASTLKRTSWSGVLAVWALCVLAAALLITQF